MKNFIDTTGYKIDNKDFYKTVLRLGTPYMIQVMLQSVVGMLDVFMVGQLGETEITAVALGSQWFMLCFFIFNGITSAASVFIAQHWGKKDTESIHKYMGIMFSFLLLIGLSFLSVSVFFPETIMNLYSNDPAVISLGAQYIQILGIQCLIMAIIMGFGTALVATENTLLPMICSAISIVTNLIFNYLFIFGKFGLPAMGVKGAAYATVIALILQIILLTSAIFIKKYDICTTIKDYFTIPKKYVINYFRHGFFLIMCEVVFGIGTNIYNIGYKYTGTEGQAALEIVSTFHGIAMVTANGICTAAGIMICKKLGNREFAMAKLYGNRFLWLIPSAAAILGIAFACISPLLLSIFNINELTYDYAHKMMIIMACVIPLKSLSYATVVGILRSGGDSWYCFFTNVVGNWLVGIPMVFLGAMILHLPVYWVYLMVAAEEIGKLCVCLPRVIQNKWVNDLTVSKDLTTK